MLCWYVNKINAYFGKVFGNSICDVRDFAHQRQLKNCSWLVWLWRKLWSVRENHGHSQLYNLGKSTLDLQQSIAIPTNNVCQWKQQQDNIKQCCNKSLLPRESRGHNAENSGYIIRKSCWNKAFVAKLSGKSRWGHTKLNLQTFLLQRNAKAFLYL